MILNNYWRWLEGCLKYPIYDEHAQVDTDVGMKNTSGETAKIMYGSSGTTRNAYISANREISKDALIKIGIGDGEITENSYNVLDDITDSLDNVTFNYVSSTSPNGIRRVISISGTNNTGESVTITQVGFGKEINWVSNESYQYNDVLFIITELDNALTVANGDSFTITLEWLES